MWKINNHMSRLSTLQYIVVCETFIRGKNFTHCKEAVLVRLFKTRLKCKKGSTIGSDQSLQWKKKQQQKIFRSWARSDRPSMQYACIQRLVFLSFDVIPTHKMLARIFFALVTLEYSVLSHCTSNPNNNQCTKHLL